MRELELDTPLDTTTLPLGLTLSSAAGTANLIAACNQRRTSALSVQVSNLSGKSASASDSASVAASFRFSSSPPQRSERAIFNSERKAVMAMQGFRNRADEALQEASSTSTRAAATARPSTAPTTSGATAKRSMADAGSRASSSSSRGVDVRGSGPGTIVTGGVFGVRPASASADNSTRAALAGGMCVCVVCVCVYVCVY
jgi:hypothetical protein